MVVKDEKKNPMWDKVFEDGRMSEEINKDLPEFLKIAIKHERKCVKFRLKQIEGYLDRITHLEAGMDYFDTFNVIKSMSGVPFPREEYNLKKQEWEKAHKKKNEKTP